MGDFNEILKAAIDGGDHLESAMRKAASLAAKEAIESLLRTETKAILGYDRHDPSGKNSAVPEACPFCGCGRIAKNGRRPDGVQKYSCRGCGRFLELTGADKIAN